MDVGWPGQPEPPGPDEIRPGRNGRAVRPFLVRLNWGKSG